MPGGPTADPTLPPGAPAPPVVEVGGLKLGGGEPVFILGPCMIESEDFAFEMARSVVAVARPLGAGFIFKASYDKANRTSVGSARGVGIGAGCRVLAAVREAFGVPVTTDVHTAAEAEQAAEFVDLIQVPAFLCRQTDLLQAAAETGRAVNVKKGQFLAPWDVRPIAEKLEHFGCRHYFFTERGTTFGYRNLIADMRSLYWIRELGYRVVFDATHSVQRPGGMGGSTGGDGVLAPVLARAAVAAGCDGIFLETHRDPPNALSDGPNQVPLDDLGRVLAQLVALHRMLRSLPPTADSPCEGRPSSKMAQRAGTDALHPGESGAAFPGA